MLPIVVQHGKIKRIDAAKIVGVERVLAAHPRRCFGPEIVLEKTEYRPQDRQAGQAQLAAAGFQLGREILVDECVKNNAGIGFHFRKRVAQLFLIADQRKYVLDRGHGRILGGGGAAHGEQRLAGRIGNQMQVEKALVFMRFRTHSIFHRSVDNRAGIDCNMARRAVPGENNVFMHNDSGLKNFAWASGENRALELV